MATSNTLERLGIVTLIAAVLFLGAAVCGPIPVPVVHRVVVWCGAVVGAVLLLATIGWLVRLASQQDSSDGVLAAAGVIVFLTASFIAYPTRFWSTTIETSPVARLPASGEGPDQHAALAFRDGSAAMPAEHDAR